MQTSKSCYDDDFYLWTQQQATLLRAEKWPDLDYGNLAEEIESLGQSTKRELGNRLVVLLMHLLKWRYQPEGHRQGHSWEDTIWEQRGQIADVLADSPSLRPQVAAYLYERYPRARRQALREMQLPEAALPATCPWTPEQILDDDFWPADSMSVS